MGDYSFQVHGLNLGFDSSYEVSFNNGMRSVNPIPIRPGYHLSVAGQEEQGQTLGQILSLSAAMPWHAAVTSGNVYANRDNGNGYGDDIHGQRDNGDGDNCGDYGNDRSNYDDDVGDQMFYDHRVEEVGSRHTMTSREDVVPHISSLLQFAPATPLSSPQPHPLSPQPHSLSPPKPHTPQPEMPGGHYSLEQLQVLYKAKSRQVSELTRQLVAQKEDTERHVEILRDKQVLK